MEDNTPINKSNFVIIILCPYCKVRFPRIKLLPSEDEMNIKVKCKCLVDCKIVSINDFVNSLKANPIEVHTCPKEEENNCIKCTNRTLKEIISLENLDYNQHILSKSKLLISCNEHNNNIYEFYCKRCKYNLCVTCKTKHTIEHKDDVIGLERITYFNNEEKAFKQHQANNRLLIDNFISRLNIDNEKHIQMRKNIQIAYEVNESINHNLVKLQQIIHNTTVFFWYYICYEIEKYGQILLNCTKYIEEKSRPVEEEYKELLNYFKTQFILKEHKPFILHIKHKIIEYYCIKLFQLADNKLLFSLYNDIQHILTIYDLTLNKWIKTLDVSTDYRVSLILLLKHGKLIITYDTKVRIWDLNNEQLLVEIKEGNTTCLLELNDQRIALGQENGIIKLYEIYSYKCTSTLSKHKSYVSCILHLIDGRLASGSNDKTIKIWNIFTNQCITTLKEKEYIYNLLQLNDSRLISTSLISPIHMWDIQTFKCSNVNTKKRYVENIIKLKDGRLLYCISNKMKLFNTLTHKSMLVFKTNAYPFDKMIILNDGRIAFYSRFSLKIYDIGLYNVV